MIRLLDKNNKSKAVFNFCEDYKDFITKSKTERETVIETINLAKENGFKNLKTIIDKKEKLKAGDKVYMWIWIKTLYWLL